MYLITNRNLCSKEKYLNTIVEAAKNKVDYLILREKDLDYPDLKDLYLEILQELEKNSTDIKIIVNSAIELYENYSVYGIHLPYHKFKNMVEDKYKFDKDKAIGLSLHTVEDVVEVEDIIEKNDIEIEYITLSHIYETKCKEGLNPKGIELLKKARNITKIKIVALGGILPQNVGEVINYCDDFAVMSTLFKNNDVNKIIEAYNQNIK